MKPLSERPAESRNAGSWMKQVLNIILFIWQDLREKVADTEMQGIVQSFSVSSIHILFPRILSLFPDTELYKMAKQGLFVPAEEKERIRELQLLINNLTIRTHLFANTVSNFIPITAYLPYDRERATNELQYVWDNVDEIEMQEYRKNLKSLG